MRATEIDLQGRTALVTGAAGGLGRAMALGLLATGAKVVFTDVSGRALEELSKSLVPSERALVVAADLTSAADREKLLRAVQVKFGAVDVLVNNAGVSSQLVRPDFITNPVRFWEHDERITRTFFEVNSVAPQMLAIAVVRGMMERRWGRIINVTTSLDTMLRQGMSGYGGSKAALEANSAVMAAELEGTGVTVNVLVPGGMADTAMIPPESDIERARLISPERMAPPVIWLASDHSADVTAHRFRAVQWNDDLPFELAAEQAGAPIAWSALGAQAVLPQ